MIRAAHVRDGHKHPASRSRPAPSPQPGPAAKLDLRCLDGLRALCSASVVLFHCYCIFVALFLQRPDGGARLLRLVRGQWFVG